MGITLPGSVDEFKRDYPPQLLKGYTEQHFPDLYDTIQTTFIDINRHCTEFKNDTMNRSVVVATSIASFGETPTTAAATAAAALKVTRFSAASACSRLLSSRTRTS